MPSTRASSHASLDKNDKSNAKIDTHLTPGLILTVFGLCLPVNKFIPVPVLFRLVLLLECSRILESKRKIREMAGFRSTLWDLTRKKVFGSTGSQFTHWKWNYSFWVLKSNAEQVFSVTVQLVGYSAKIVHLFVCLSVCLFCLHIPSLSQPEVQCRNITKITIF